jgi:putative zinc finger protein
MPDSRSGRGLSSSDEMPETLSEAVPTACVEVIRQIWDHLDDQLPSDESDFVRLHLVECVHCRDFERSQMDYRQAMRSIRPRRGIAPWHVRARVLDTLADAGFCP